MKTTKHFALTALLVVGATLYASAPALGQQTWLFTGSAKLTPAGDEVSASGRVNLSGQEVDSTWGYFLGGDVSVSCSGLTRNATYLIAMPDTYGGWSAQIASSDGVADGRGNLTITSSWSSGGWGGGHFDTLEVYRVEPTGYVLVLSGTISYHYKYARFH